MSKHRPVGNDQSTADVGPLSTGPDAYAFLLVLEGGVSTHRIPLAGSVVLGRTPDCDVIADDESVSRRHATVHAGCPPTIEDLGSRNGTRVLGRRLTPGERHPLAVGMVVDLGGVALIVQRAGRNLPASMATAPTESPSGVIVQDPRMEHLYRLIDVIAPGDIPVLVLGETGVGKEVFAETIHKRSTRVGRPFLRLNCAALTESLLESELFGHEKGSFTGAISAKQGLFESANGGTVFLDEIGELPLSTQAKLLRVLENGEVMRIGSVRPMRIDVRFVAATNRDLSVFIEQGRFRADLYYRLDGVSVTIPPLRERPAEIQAFADFFAIQAFRRSGKPARPLSTGAAGALSAHTWPGNIRELRNVMERAALLCQGNAIEVEHLSLGQAPATMSPPPPARASATRLPEIDDDLQDQMDTFERARIVDALDRCAGNQTRAAEVLGISRRWLVKKLAAHGIARPRTRG